MKKREERIFACTKCIADRKDIDNKNNASNNYMNNALSKVQAGSSEQSGQEKVKLEKDEFSAEIRNSQDASEEKKKGDGHHYMRTDMRRCKRQASEEETKKGDENGHQAKEEREAETEEEQHEILFVNHNKESVCQEIEANTDKGKVQDGARMDSAALCNNVINSDYNNNINNKEPVCQEEGANTNKGNAQERAGGIFGAVLEPGGASKVVSGTRREPHSEQLPALWNAEKAKPGPARGNEPADMELAERSCRWCSDAHWGDALPTLMWSEIAAGMQGAMPLPTVVTYTGGTVQIRPEGVYSQGFACPRLR
eukprot:PhM_4_TR16737/c1_g1_i12/m.30564